MSDGWTDERVAELKKLWLQGLSGSRIAVVLGGGLSRSAVIGKITRLGICRSAQVTQQTKAIQSRLNVRPPKPPKAAPTPSEPKVVPLRPVEPAAFAGPSKLLPELLSGECRWPLDDPGPGRMEETRFCGAPGARLLSEGMPYCEHHQRRAIQPSKPRKLSVEPTHIRRRAS